MLQVNPPIVNCLGILGNINKQLKRLQDPSWGRGGGRGEDFQQYLPFVCTVKALEGGHPRDAEKVSVTIQAGCL